MIAVTSGQDKLATDIGVDLQYTGLSVVSIWVGAQLTGRLKMVIASDPAKYGYLEAIVETPEFTGHAISALSNDPQLASLNGQTLIGGEIATRYGFANVEGRQPPSYRDIYGIAPLPQFDRIIRQAGQRLSSGWTISYHYLGTSGGMHWRVVKKLGKHPICVSINRWRAS